MTTLLAQELLASSLAMVRGKVHRMPKLFLARNTAPSIATGGWHPHQMLATEPAALFRQCMLYWEVLLEHLTADAGCRVAYPLDQMQQIVDRAHLKYLAPMLSRPIMEYLVEQSMRSDTTPRQIVESFWKRFVPPEESGVGGKKPYLAQIRTLLDPSYASEVFRYIRRLLGLYYALRFREKKLVIPLSSLFDRLTVIEATCNGRQRHYGISRSLVSQDFAQGGRITPSDLRSMISHFDDYV
jgi:hypothetical protein